ncbi:hypothetical protein [Halomarina oriensis]|uniref:Uncharacterized protein n=1 Tax=Halomarina oriensis TaxID=671145 RepID=A0A6B0GM06_9EURY|nr:hypothetical protein [Halomarina oriensis]MWG35882.1 hypothetical protein [Halomarina oriensis]
MTSTRTHALAAMFGVSFSMLIVSGAAVVDVPPGDALAVVLVVGGGLFYAVQFAELAVHYWVR